MFSIRLLVIPTLASTVKRVNEEFQGSPLESRHSNISQRTAAVAKETISGELKRG